MYRYPQNYDYKRNYNLLYSCIVVFHYISLSNQLPEINPLFTGQVSVSSGCPLFVSSGCPVFVSSGCPVFSHFLIKLLIN